jgi:hypothetical protein
MVDFLTSDENIGVRFACDVIIIKNVFGINNKVTVL